MGDLFEEYEIQEGDTLSGIALKKLGKANDWVTLYIINKKVINEEAHRRGFKKESYNRIFPGTIIRIPLKANG